MERFFTAHLPAGLVASFVKASWRAALVFAVGYLMYLIVRRLLKFDGLRFVWPFFLFLVSIRVFEYNFIIGWDRIVDRVVLALTFVVGVFILLTVLDHVVFVRVAERRRWGKVPRIFREVTRLTVLVVATLFAVYAFLGVKPTALIATSTVLSAVVGLAMQDLLANLFSGIALQMGKPFRIGDWVTVYNQTGQVISTTWRSTRIRTRDNTLVDVPNANISKTEICNYSAPTPLQRRAVDITLGYEHPPNQVKGVLVRAALATEGVLRAQPPDVLLTEFGENGIGYRLRFWLDDFKEALRVEDQVRTAVWYNLRRAGLSVPYPHRTVTLRRLDESTKVTAERRRRRRVMSFLDGVDLFEGLSAADKERLAADVEERTYAAGETIVRQGDEGTEFYIVTKGKVRTEVCEETKTLGFGPFGPGFFFGEMSLLTGEPRSATVYAVEDVDVLVVTKEHFREIVSSHEELAGKLSRAVERRRAEVAAGWEAAGGVGTAAEDAGKYDSESVLKKIKEFFNLK